MPFWVYIMASKPRGVLYTGVTNDLARRVWEHKNGHGSKFAQRYQVHRLAWAQAYADVKEAIGAEKRIKRWHRAWKIELVERSNFEWDDLVPW